LRPLTFDMQPLPRRTAQGGEKRKRREFRNHLVRTNNEPVVNGSATSTSVRTVLVRTGKLRSIRAVIFSVF